MTQTCKVALRLHPILIQLTLGHFKFSYGPVWPNMPCHQPIRKSVRLRAVGDERGRCFRWEALGLGDALDELPDGDE
jgi:hypothetical protein